MKSTPIQGRIRPRTSSLSDPRGRPREIGAPWYFERRPGISRTRGELVRWIGPAASLAVAAWVLLLGCAWWGWRCAQVALS